MSSSSGEDTSVNEESKKSMPKLAPKSQHQQKQQQYHEEPPTMSERGVVMIIGEIVRTIANGHNTKTGIQYTCNLGWAQVTRYLIRMSKLGLITQQNDRLDGSQYYALTEKGNDYLDTVTKLEQIAGPPMPRGFYKKTAETLKSSTRTLQGKKKKEKGKEEKEAENDREQNKE